MEQVKPEAVRCIAGVPEPGVLEQDLEILKDKARAAGAEDVRVISPGQVVFMEQKPEDVLPLAHKSAHWPLAYPKDNIRAAMLAFDKAFFFRVKARDIVRDYSLGPIPNFNHRKIYRKSFEVVTAVESAAFYQGHHLAFGYATGNCRSVFCFDEKRCWALIKGRVCVHPYKARPCLAAVGIDVPETARAAGMPDVAGNEEPFVGGLVMIA